MKPAGARRIKVAVSVVLLIGLAAAAYLARLKREQPDAPVLDTLRNKMEARTFETFYEYGRAHAASADFQKRFFAESADPKDHFRFVAYLDTSLLPTMQSGMRVGTKEQRERWIESQTRWLEGYWQNLSDNERRLLKDSMRSKEGQQLVQGSAKFYLGELTTSEKQELQPLTGQIATILDQIGKE